MIRMYVPDTTGIFFIEAGRKWQVFGLQPNHTMNAAAPEGRPGGGSRNLS
jgi:hypothetical protein